MCLSGFEDSNKHSLNRLLRALGITSTSVFSRRNTHLLCHSATGPKFEMAQEWGIPVVSMTWLNELSEMGRVPDTKVYTTNQAPEVCVAVAQNIEVDTGDEIIIKSVDKGKGKATAVELDAMDLDNDRMQDITNSECLVNYSYLSSFMAVSGAPAAEQLSRPQPVKPEPSPLRRQNTTTPAPKPPEKKESIFGLPNSILGGSSSPQLEEHRPDVALRTTTISPSLSMAMLQDGVRSRQGSFAGVLHSQGSDLQQGIIPSSTSPSPMKPPSQKGGSFRQSLSPVKIDHEATKALQESITSLLGKRPSPDVEESTPDTGMAGRAKGSRPGKRVRPQRSKVGLFPLLIEPDADRL